MNKASSAAVQTRRSNLLRQPIPAVEDTMTAGLNTVAPFLNGMQQTISRLAFGCYSAVAGKYQKRLLTLAQEEPINWGAEGLTRLWLSCREGLPFYNNYVAQLEDDPRTTDMIERAARLLTAALRLHQDIRDGWLLPDVEGDRRLDMEQYRRCFGTHRLPHAVCDEIRGTEGNHIAVLAAGRVYALAVDSPFDAGSEEALRAALEEIIADARQIALGEDNAGPGLFTALPRAEWSRVRATLTGIQPNAATLAALEDALFVLCLDIHSEPGSLTGMGSHLRDGECHNRFYDKSLQIVVTANGKAGLIFERAAVDGGVALGFIARLLHKSGTPPPPAPRASKPRARMRRLPWVTNAALAREYAGARVRAQDCRAQRRVEVWTEPGVGRDDFMRHKMSADAIAQLAVQLAYRLHFGHVPNIHEPVQIRHFAGGRMDFITTVTEESLALVEALADNHTGAQRLPVLLHKAIAAHRRHIDRAKGGRGAIAHLLALSAARHPHDRAKGAEAQTRQQAFMSHLDRGLGLFVNQEVFAANCSGVPGVAAFGPTGAHGNMLSIGYIIGKQGMTFHVRADGRYRDSAQALRTHLGKAMRSLGELLDKSGVA